MKPVTTVSSPFIKALSFLFIWDEKNILHRAYIVTCSYEAKMFSLYQEIVVGSNMDKIYIVMDYVEHDLKVLMEHMTHWALGLVSADHSSCQSTFSNYGRFFVVRL